MENYIPQVDDLVELHPLKILAVDPSDRTVNLKLHTEDLRDMWVHFSDIRALIDRPLTSQEIIAELRTELDLVKDQLHDAKYQIEVLEGKFDGR